jgi:hypothetical protein
MSMRRGGVGHHSFLEHALTGPRKAVHPYPSRMSWQETWSYDAGHRLARSGRNSTCTGVAPSEQQVMKISTGCCEHDLVVENRGE